MSIHFPPEFQQHLKAPSTRAAFVSKIEPRHPRDCKNCGGLGTMILFIATAGPFRDVPTGIAHFAAGHWWTGKNIEEACPDCKGNGINPQYIEQPVSMRKVDTTGVLKPTIKVEYSDI